MEKATFGAGCFWCVEEDFRKVKGVTDVACGYSGGTAPNPTYQKVCSSRTGHAEVVEIQFDPKQVSFEELLQVFFSIHDPTQLDRQGPDVGSQYRSAIFYHSDAQKETALKTVEQLQKTSRFSGVKIVTEIKPVKEFYRAEEYHQRYYDKIKSPNISLENLEGGI